MSDRGVVIIIAAVLLLFGPVFVSAQTYKWVGDDGQVHYSDSIPPDETGKRREREVKSDSGLTVDRIEPPPTRKELNTRAVQRARAAEQARAAAEQRERDRTLLQTFENVAAMKRARNERLGAIDGQIKLAQQRRQSLQSRYETLQQRAAAAERDSSGDLDNLYAQIEKVEAQLRSQHEFIERRRREQASIRARFEVDIQRFHELTQSSD